jgi:hypothetical protein
MVNTSIDILPPLYSALKSSYELSAHASRQRNAICASQQRFAIAIA